MTNTPKCNHSIGLYDLASEKALLGAIVLENAVLDSVQIAGKHFQHPTNRTLFEAMQALRADGMPCDAVTLADALQSNGKLEEVGGVGYVHEVLEAVPHTTHADYYAQIVIEKWQRRQVKRLGEELMEAANDLSRDIDEISTGLPERVERIGNTARFGPVLVRMADVEPRAVNWLWPKRIAAGRLNLLVGMPGAGKSFLTCDMASRVSTGTPWPDGTDCPRGSVILISAEDDSHDTIRPRLDAHYADVSRIHLLSTVRRLDKDGKQAELMFSLNDVSSLETALKQVGDCRLIVVDPVGSFLGGRTDAHRDNEVRSVLAPVAKLAEKYGPAIVVVAHRRKAAGSIADDTALGSRAFTGIARAVWHLSRDRENKNRRLLLSGKQNLVAEQTGLAFSICGEPAAVAWEREPVDLTADEALAMENEGTGHGSAADEAVAWLREKLADGPTSAKEVKDGARANGIAPRTLDRAKVKLRVVAGPDGFGGPWVWRLPECATVSAECANDERLAHSEETGALCASTAKNGDDWGEV